MMTAETARMSQALEKPYRSFRKPPRMGPMMVPREPAILKEAEALSLIWEQSLTPSFSSMASIISASSGTNTVAVVIPSTKNPAIDSALLSYGKPNIVLGPNINIAPAPIKNEH